MDIKILTKKMYEGKQHRGKTKRLYKLVAQLSGVPIPMCRAVFTALPKALAILLNETGSYWWRGFAIFYKMAFPPKVYEGLNRRTMQRQKYKKGWTVYMRVVVMRPFKEWCGGYKLYNPETDKVLFKGEVK